MYMMYMYTYEYIMYMYMYRVCTCNTCLYMAPYSYIGAYRYRYIL